MRLRSIRVTAVWGLIRTFLFAREHLVRHGPVVFRIRHINNFRHGFCNPITDSSAFTGQFFLKHGQQVQSAFSREQIIAFVNATKIGATDQIAQSYEGPFQQLPINFCSSMGHWKAFLRCRKVSLKFMA